MLVDLVIYMEIGPSLSRPRILEALGRGKVRLTLRRAEFFMFDYELISISLASIFPPDFCVFSICIFILGTFFVAKAKFIFEFGG